MSLPQPTQSRYEGQKTLPPSNVGKPVARRRFEVAIKPTRYVPGTGPPLRPITLLPRADTTAYIRGEFIVPKTASGDGKVHVVYLVGWTDLPSVRLTVDAAEIFDYVSEREYERWNFERSEERDELERKLEEEENVRAVELAILAEQQEEQRQRQDGTALRNGAFRLTGSESSMSRESSPPALQKRQKTKHSSQKVPAAQTQSLLQQETVIPLSSLGETEGDTSDNDEDAIRRQLREEQDEIAMETEFLQPPAKKRRTVSPAPPPLKSITSQKQRLAPVAKPLASKQPAPKQRASKSPAPKHPASKPPAPVPKRETPVPIPVVPPQRPQVLKKVLKTKSPTVAGPSKFPGSLSNVSTAASSRSTSLSTPPGKGKGGGFQPGNLLRSSTAKKVKKPKPPKLDPTEIVRFEANQDWEVKRLLGTKIVKEGGKSVRLFHVLWKGEWPPDQNPTWEPEENIPKKMARKFLRKAATMGMDGADDTPSPPPSWRPDRTFSSVSEAFAGDAVKDSDEDSAAGAGETHGWHNEKDEYSEEDEEEDGVLLVTDEPTPHRTPFNPSNLEWEMAMGRRFGESLAG